MYRSITKLWHVSKTQPSFFFNTVGTGVTWLGGVKLCWSCLCHVWLPLELPRQFQCPWRAFPLASVGLDQSFTFASNKDAYKNIEKRHQWVEVKFACAELELPMPREAAFPME